VCRWRTRFTAGSRFRPRRRTGLWGPPDAASRTLRGSTMSSGCASGIGTWRKMVAFLPAKGPSSASGRDCASVGSRLRSCPRSQLGPSYSLSGTGTTAMRASAGRRPALPDMAAWGSHAGIGRTNAPVVPVAAKTPAATITATLHEHRRLADSAGRDRCDQVQSRHRLAGGAQHPPVARALGELDDVAGPVESPISRECGGWRCSPRPGVRVSRGALMASWAGRLWRVAGVDL
jgi:hypothetical protein